MQSLMMKRFALLMLVMFGLNLTAFAADIPAGDIFGGFSIVHHPARDAQDVTVSPLGWAASAAYNVNKVAAVAGRFSGTYKTVNGSKLENYSYFFGPRFNFRQDKVTYFAEAGFGGLRSAVGAVRNNAFAMSFGGGIDIRAGKSVVIRAIEFDWVPNKRPSSLTGWDKKNTSYSFGLDFPFGTK